MKRTILVFISMLGSTELSAQRVTSSVDVSGTGVWYGDSVHSAGASLAPAMRVDWLNATLSASAALSRLGGGSSFQANVAPSVFTPNAGRFSGEFAAQLGGSSHQDGTRTGSALGFARAYATFGNAGAWGGVGAGSTWDGDTWRGVRQAELGAWLERAPLTTLATVSPVVVDDTLRYTDVEVALRYPTHRFELGVTAGTRAGTVGPEIGGATRVWGSLTGVVWLFPGVAFVANAGTYPVDFTQGYPGGRFVAVALRFATRNSQPSPTVSASSAPVLQSALEMRSPAATDFVVRTTSGQRRTIRVNAPGARTVEVNGDFTHWRAVSLVRQADGWWSIALPIAAGTHQVNLRVDAGPWIAPPGLLSTTDEFGGVIGILSIE